ncbi:hypothetical protein DFH08DRAFT_964202 [Mycena albidolilacea]|uniref:Helix-turn-helix domain-containing protein n=1 Tax=Mycena albidolilacea TaxID=1033008 RepID=A0AAD6ZTP1_9AGAR|nr:hypothetical protein DFH08DRAFT_964202 [Mycena albidolilacea]
MRLESLRTPYLPTLTTATHRYHESHIHTEGRHTYDPVIGGISDGGDDDEDSYEAQARREEQRFPLDEIVASHEDRLRSAASYHIPTLLLQSGAATPLRSDNADHNKDIGSHPTSPAPSWNSALPVQSHAATPAYIPTDKVAHNHTPLFLPGSRDPTPFLPREETPHFFPPLPQFNNLLDMTALDSDEDGDGDNYDDDDDEEETFSDKEFLDDDEDLDFENWNRPPQIEDKDDLHAIATEYKHRGKVFQKALNAYLYIPWNSCHSTDSKRAWVKGELIRYVHLCSKESDFNSIRTEFVKRLRVRGYPGHWLRDVFEEVNYAAERPSALKPAVKTVDCQEVHVLKLTHNPVWDDIILSPVWHNLADAWNEFGAGCPELRFMASYEKPVALGDRLNTTNRNTLEEYHNRICRRRRRLLLLLAGYREAMDMEAPGRWEAGGEEPESEDSDVVSDPEAVPENEEFKTLQTVQDIQAAHKVTDVAARDQSVEGLTFDGHIKVENERAEGGIGNGGDHVLERVNFSKACKQRHYPEVTPTPAQRQLFADTSIYLIRRLKFQGLSPALVEGDRVVALAGRHSGTNSYIVHLQGIWYKALGTHFLWAKRNDRVRILGEMWKGVYGRVVEVNSTLPTITIPRDVAVLGESISAIGQETITVPMRFVTRDWHLGDSVRPDQPPVGKCLLQGEAAAVGQFAVRAANVDFDEGGNEVERPPTPPHPLSEAPPPHHVLNELKLMRTRPTYENIPVFVGNMLGIKTILKGLQGVVVGWHKSAARVERHAKLRKWGKQPKDDQAGILLIIRPTASLSMTSSLPVADIPIEHVYHQFTGLPLMEAIYIPQDKLLKVHPSGYTALSIGTQQAMRAVTPPPAPSNDSQWAPDDLRTVIQAVPATIPVVSEATLMDKSGMWMCLLRLHVKCVDVQIIGVKQLTGRVSAKMLLTEGQCRYMLIEAEIRPSNKKVWVCGLGKHNTLRIDIEKQCCVVIIGADVLKNQSHVGYYAQTIPFATHAHGPEVVAVKSLFTHEDPSQSPPHGGHLLAVLQPRRQSAHPQSSRKFPDHITQRPEVLLYNGRMLVQPRMPALLAQYGLAEERSDGHAPPLASDEDLAAEELAVAASDGADLMFIKHTPPPDPTKHRRKRAAQWQRWQNEVLPKLLPHFA